MWLRWPREWIGTLGEVGILHVHWMIVLDVMKVLYALGNFRW